jgi:hypothetical protein
MSKQILYDLGIAVASVALWVTPFKETRAVGYSLSLIFSARAYYSGIILLNKERKNDEIEGIQYEASVDFYERLLESHIDSALEVASTNIETKTLEKLIPLIAYRTKLEQQVTSVHPEMTDADREAAAKSAIDDVFVSKSKNDCSEITEEDIRKQFPEELDTTSWKAILKALQTGATKNEIVKDVLGCTDQRLGLAYYELLKGKFLE